MNTVTYPHSIIQAIEEYCPRAHNWTEKIQKYICPVCGGDNLQVASNGSGKYECWDEDHPKAIFYEKLSKQVEDPELRKTLEFKARCERGEVRSSNRSSSKPNPTYGKRKSGLSLSKGVSPAVLPLSSLPGSLSFIHLNDARLSFKLTRKKYFQDEYPEFKDCVFPTVQHFYSSTQYCYRYLFPNGKKSFWVARSEGGKEKSGSAGKLAPYGFLPLSHLIKSNQLEGNAVLVVEGEKVADYWMSRTGRLALSLPGSQANEDSIHSLAKLFKKLNITPVYIPDNDKSGQQKASTFKKVCHQEGVPCLVVDVSQRLNLPNKGDLADAIARIEKQELNYEGYMKPGEDFGADDDLFFDLIAEVDEAAKEELEEERRSLESVVKKTPSPEEVEAVAPHPEIPSARTVADRLEVTQGRNYCYVTSTQQWWSYDKKTGCWDQASNEDLLDLVQREFDSFGPNGSYHQLKQAVNFLQVKLRRKEDFIQPPNLIGFTNGVMDKNTNTFRPHSPSNYLLFTLPYEFNAVEFTSRKELAKDIQPILSWLLQSVGGTSEDYALVELLLRYLAAVIRGYTKYQKYLEIIGTAGSGKGTFLRLATALVGRRNSASTQLNVLEKNTFEMSKLTQAALVKITDAEKWQGDCQNLLAFIGEDDLRVEKKGVQQKLGEDSSAIGLLILAGERSPTFSAGGMQRRRITVPFMNAVSERERTDLLTIKNNGEIHGVLAPYIPKLFQFLLTYTEEEISDFVKNTNSIPRYVQIRASTILDTNPIAQFLEDKCFYHPNVDEQTGLPAISVQIGVKKWDNTLGDFENSEKHLYPAFCKWCRENGVHELSLKVFKKNLIELMNEQLKLPVTDKRTANGSFIYGLGLRSFSAIFPATEAKLPRLITETYSVTQVEAIAAAEKGCPPQPILRMEKRQGKDWFDFEQYYADQERLSQSGEEAKDQLQVENDQSNDGNVGCPTAETPTVVDTDGNVGYSQVDSKKEDKQEGTQVEGYRSPNFPDRTAQHPSFPSVSTREPLSGVEDLDLTDLSLHDHPSSPESSPATTTSRLKRCQAYPQATAPTPTSTSMRDVTGDKEDSDEEEYEVVDHYLSTLDNEEDLHLEDYLFEEDDD